jgi:hypothetical protein
VKGIPHVFIIDKTGKVAHIHKGYDESALPGFLDEINVLLLAPYEDPKEVTSRKASFPRPWPARTAALQR